MTVGLITGADDHVTDVAAALALAARLGSKTLTAR